MYGAQIFNGHDVHHPTDVNGPSTGCARNQNKKSRMEKNENGRLILIVLRIDYEDFFFFRKLIKNVLVAFKILNAFLNDFLCSVVCGHPSSC